MLSPLAERMRPRTIEEYIGQGKLLGRNGFLNKCIKEKFLPSLILWGPPGVGKTTLALLLSKYFDLPFKQISAINAGVKDIREVIKAAKESNLFSRKKTILFIDEIHRFNKSQQDALLASVEKGEITLIGATTENPSFEVIPALISRSQVLVLEAHSPTEMKLIVERAIEHDEQLNKLDIKVEEYEKMMLYAGGDARKLLNILELLSNSLAEPIRITNEIVEENIQNNTIMFDKSGEEHYNIISAFIKSIRGSNPNAAVYWLARLLVGGEDVKFIARRLIILAAEDIGLANPNAMLLANACFDAVNKIGMPEARIPLSEVTIYLANSPKSNSAYVAINQAMAHVKESGALPVPLHLRNASTKLMKQLGYGDNYKYSHNYKNNFSEQNYFPEGFQHQVYYQPAENVSEKKYMEMLKNRWKNDYK